MRFGSWNGVSLSSARVDSALAGSQEEASLFCTSASFDARKLDPTASRSQKTSTSHLVTGPVSRPAICRCMIRSLSTCAAEAHQDYPSGDPEPTPSGGPELS